MPADVPLVDLAFLENVFDQMVVQGVPYLLDAKPWIKAHNPRSTGHMDTPVNTVDRSDCSGFALYALKKATGQKIDMPDGSQQQLQWAIDKGLHRVANYSDVNAYITRRRLFLCFIKVGVNGAGGIGHVWFAAQRDDDPAADTMECHSPTGVSSRPWDYPTLRRQCYAAFELPIK